MHSQGHNKKQIQYNIRSLFETHARPIILYTAKFIKASKSHQLQQPSKLTANVAHVLIAYNYFTYFNATRRTCGIQLNCLCLAQQWHAQKEETSTNIPMKPLAILAISTGVILLPRSALLRIHHFCYPTYSNNTIFVLHVLFNCSVSSWSHSQLIR